MQKSTPLIQVTAAGLLSIGDPHVSARKPGTRNDANFIDVVIGKIEQAARIANEHDLQAVITGDLFDRDRETDPYLLVRLIRALNLFVRKPFELMGNHDINETDLTDNTSLALLREAGVLQVITQPGLFMELTRPDGKILLVGATPYGMAIPDAVDGEGGAGVVWYTHHDLAFEGAYPTATLLREIPGIDLVINGHMHLTKPVVVTGKTRWFNPGNITRQSKDTAEHVPSVWMTVDPRVPAVQFPLEYRKGIFDAIEGYVPPVAMERPPASVFVNLLKDYQLHDIAQTEDGSVLAADLVKLIGERKVPHDVAKTVMDLHAKVTA